MTTQNLLTLSSYVCGTWHVATEGFRSVHHAITGEKIYQVSSAASICRQQYSMPNSMVLN